MRTSHIRERVVIRRFYASELEQILQRKLSRSDGISFQEIGNCEKRLATQLPIALREYYAIAGKLDINVEHNRLYTPRQLKNWRGKLVFMEENQNVVFWGVDIDDSGDPEVLQACNEMPLRWYSEECTLSRFIVKMWRWQRGLGDPG